MNKLSDSLKLVGQVKNELDQYEWLIDEITDKLNKACLIAYSVSKSVEEKTPYHRDTIKLWMERSVTLDQTIGTVSALRHK